MLRKIAVLAVLVVVIAAAFASAANLPVNGGTILAGQDMTLACDPDGVKVSGWGLETDDNTVRSVTITGIHGDCAGAEMFVHVTIAGTITPVKVKGILDATGTKAFSFNPYLDPTKIEGIKIWVEGYN